MIGCRRGWPVLLSLALLSLQGCGSLDRLSALIQRDDRGGVALRVGHKNFTPKDLSDFFDGRLNEFRSPADADRVKSDLLESFVEERLLLLRADELKIEANPQALSAMMKGLEGGVEAGLQGKDRKARLSDIERSFSESLRIQQFLHDHVLKGAEVTNQECEEYYSAHMAEFVIKDVVRVREILVDDAARAEGIRARVVAERNKNFADLARVYSKGPNASDGGNLGNFQRGDLPEEFEKVIFALAPGSVSRIVKSTYGYHLFLVEEKIAAHQQKLYEVKEQIRERLQLEREREAIDREVSRLAAQAGVEIRRQALDFNYVGARFSVQH